MLDDLQPGFEMFAAQQTADHIPVKGTVELALGTCQVRLLAAVSKSNPLITTVVCFRRYRDEGQSFQAAGMHDMCKACDHSQEAWECYYR